MPLSPSTQAADPTEFFVPSPGKDGLALGARVAADLKQQIQQVVQSGVFHYSTESDFVRAACVWFMTEKIAPRMNARFQQDVRLMAQHNRNAQMLKRASDVDKYVETTAAALINLMKTEMVTEAVELWNESMGTAKKISPTFHEIVRKRMYGMVELKKLRLEVKARAAAVDE